jgi:hypothetical protein
LTLPQGGKGIENARDTELASSDVLRQIADLFAVQPMKRGVGNRGGTAGRRDERCPTIFEEGDVKSKKYCYKSIYPMGKNLIWAKLDIVSL